MSIQIPPKRPAPSIRVTPRMVEAAYRVLDESGLGDSEDCLLPPDMGRDCVRRMLRAAVRARRGGSRRND